MNEEVRRIFTRDPSNLLELLVKLVVNFVPAKLYLLKGTEGNAVKRSKNCKSINNSDNCTSSLVVQPEKTLKFE